VGVRWWGNYGGKYRYERWETRGRKCAHQVSVRHRRCIWFGMSSLLVIGPALVGDGYGYDVACWERGNADQYRQNGGDAMGICSGLRSMASVLRT
jgi:hypothetical protein